MKSKFPTRPWTEQPERTAETGPKASAGALAAAQPRDSHEWQARILRRLAEMGTEIATALHREIMREAAAIDAGAGRVGKDGVPRIRTLGNQFARLSNHVHGTVARCEELEARRRARIAGHPVPAAPSGDSPGDPPGDPWGGVVPGSPEDVERRKRLN
jgi:hypothetical protein